MINFLIIVHINIMKLEIEQRITEIDNIRYIVMTVPEKREIKTFKSISKAIEFIDNYNIN